MERAISWLVFLPAIGAGLLSLIPARLAAHRYVAFAFALAALGLSLALFGTFPVGSADFQWVEKSAWMPALGITYQLGLDGISLVLCVLTTGLCLLTLAATFRHERFSSKEFLVAFLVLETAMLGSFAALDVFLFYVFWEVMLVPMYFMIGKFGGERRRYATLKFFVYTMLGSVLMLVGILWLYKAAGQQLGQKTMSLLDFYRLELDFATQATLFVLFAIAFAIKIPVFPFHTWLPDAHVEAPTPGSVILAGVLLKMGGYGLLRFALPLFPQAARWFAPWMAVLAVCGILYGAFVAWAQSDMKKLVAYSSVSHMGFIVLGVFSLQGTAMSGAVFQMVAHGLSTGALFLLIGILYEKSHTRQIGDFGGLFAQMPKYTALFLAVTLGSIGMPGLSGFVGEFLILAGGFNAAALGHPELWVALASVGIILGAAYMLSMYDRVFLGKIVFERNRGLTDLTAAETAIALVPVAFMLYLGVKPGVILDVIEPSIQRLEQLLR